MEKPCIVKITKRCHFAMKKPSKTEKEQKSPSKDEQITELTDQLKRLQAEFINYRTRVEQEKLEINKRAKSDLMQQLLPVLDHFELAMKNRFSPEDFAKGVELIQQQLTMILEKEGLQHIDCINKPFNQDLHDAITSKISNNLKPDTVIEELQKGYLFKDIVLRHAKVAVTKKPENGQNKNSSDNTTQNNA